MFKNKTAFTLILFCLSYSAFAEYNGWFLKIEITTANNEVIIGHIYRASAYFEEDSLSDEHYTTKALTRSFTEDEHFVYFKTLYKYEYVPLGGLEPTHIYALLNEQGIATTEIKNISVLDRIDFSYLENIASGHKLSDTLWMKEPPVVKAIADGYLCSWQVFVHEQSANTQKVLAELAVYQTKNAQQFKKLEEELEYANGEHYREIETKIDELQESLDEMASDILAQLDGEKVVIISFCSC